MSSEFQGYEPPADGRAFQLYCWLLAGRQSLPFYRGSDLSVQCRLAAQLAHLAAREFERVAQDVAQNPSVLNTIQRMWDGDVERELKLLEQRRRKLEEDEREMRQRRAGERSLDMFSQAGGGTR